MPPTKDDNEKGSSEEEDSDSSGSNSDVSSQDHSSDVSDFKNSKKRILTSVLSRKEWTHRRWNGMAQVIK